MEAELFCLEQESRKWNSDIKEVSREMERWWEIKLLQTSVTLHLLAFKFLGPCL